MAYILSQEEVDNLLGEVDEDSTQRYTIFMQLFKDKTVNEIELLTGERPTIELFEEQSLSSISNITPPAVLVKVAVLGDVDANVMVALPAKLSASLTDLLMGNDVNYRENISQDDLGFTKEIISHLFLSIEKVIPSLSFRIEDVKFLSDNEKTDLKDFSEMFIYKINIASFDSTFMFVADDTFSTFLDNNNEIEILPSNDELLFNDEDIEMSEFPSIDGVEEAVEIDETESIVLACANGDIEKVKQYIADGVDIDTKDKNGYTSLMMASKNGHKEIVELLLNEGADIDIEVEVKRECYDWSSNRSAIDLVPYEYEYTRELLNEAKIKKNFVTITKELKDFNNLSDSEIKEMFQPLQKEDSKESEITGLYDYKLEGLDVLKEKFIKFASDARINGILALESAISEEKNPLVRFLCSMAIDGSEPRTIQTYAALAQKWLIEVHKRSVDYENKKDYLADLEKEFNLIRRGVDAVQSGEEDEVLLQALDETVNNTVEYYRFYDEQITVDEYSKDLIEEEKKLLKELQQFNETIDRFNNEITLENPDELIKRLVSYATYSRKDGKFILIEESLKERNIVLRRLLQQVGMNHKLSSLKQIVQDEIEIVKNKGYTEPDFLFDYERELTCIAIAIYMIQDGSAPRVLEAYLLVIYPEKDFKSQFD